MSRSVQIPIELFNDLCMYHLGGFDIDEAAIQAALQRKLDSLLRHEYFTQYKTAPSEAERDEARRRYLDAVNRRGG